VRILRRAWVLYVVHIFLLAVLMGIIFVANNHIETRDLAQEMGLNYFLSNPQQATVDELLLRFKPGLMDPLPLYILLLLGLPALLPLIVRCPAYAAALSFAGYAAAHLFALNLSGPSGGVWFFNPLAWQFLFVLGGVAATLSQRRTTDPALRPLYLQPLFMLAALYVMAAGLLAISWRWPQLHDAWMPLSLSQLIYPISKTDLDPLRLLHFLALAYCVARLTPKGPWLQHRATQQICRMGRYSLEVFCLGVLLAPLADITSELAGDGLAIKVATAWLGVLLMAGLAAWLDWNQRLGKRKAEGSPQKPLYQLVGPLRHTLLGPRQSPMPTV
jgi:hypothetical protein